MFIKKLCFIICTIFLFQSLYDVFEESKSVQYTKSIEKIRNFNFSFCIKLDEELLENFKNSSNNLYQFTVKQLVELTCAKFFSNSTCFNSIDLNRSYLFNYHSCLVFNDKHFDHLIRNLINVDFYIFAISNYLSQVYFFENIYKNDARLEPFLLNIQYVEYHQLESPFQTDCYNYTNEKLGFKTNEIVVTRQSCQFECFKTISRSLIYYYSRRDNKSLIVNENDLKNLKGIGKWKNLDNNLTIESRIKCLKICKKIGCKLRIYYISEFKGDRQTEFKLRYNTHIYLGKPSISKIQSIINFISLINLFLNICFYETLPYLIKKILLIYLKKYTNLIINYFWIIKLIILILCLLAIICLSLIRILDYLNNYSYKLVAFNITTEISPFYLMICVPIQVLIDNQDRLDEVKEKNLLKTKSFSELEIKTDFNVFKSRLERIYIQYASIEKEADYSIDRTKVVFKYFDYEFENYTMSNFLLRCYKIDLSIRELRYEMLYSLSKLNIILKFNWYIIYPIPKDFNLTTASNNLIFDPYLFKVIYNEKFNCIDYSKNELFSNLSDNENGINQCVNDEHLKNYDNLTIRSVIYKNSIPSKYELDRIYFNQSIDQNILNGCKKKFKDYNCLSQFFEINKWKPINQINEVFSMNLYYAEYIEIDNIILSLSDLLLNNLLSFESIFIGLNIGKLLFILFILLRRYKLDRILKYFNSIKFIIILIGLSIHLYYIIYDILNDEHILITDYSILRSIQLPNIIFCFEIYNYNQIDLNHKQTLNYLDSLTENLNLTFFKTVSFLDNNYKKTFFLPNQIETIKNLNNIYSIYFLNLKCFEFVFKLIDNTRFLSNLNDLHSISIKFNKEIILKYFNSSSFDFYLIIRKKLTNELNGIEKINFNYNDDSHSLIRVHQKYNILNVEEKFSFLQNPLSIFYNSVNLDDTTEYINQLSNDFSKFNFKTTKIITNSIDDQNMEFDDEMFDQYFYQIKNQTDFNSFKILNYRREIYLTKVVKSISKNVDDIDVKFYFNIIPRTFTFTNRDNYSKFIINILNCLSIWLNFCCFDFYIYLQKLDNPIYKFYQIILNFKFNLKHTKSQMLIERL